MLHLDRCSIVTLEARSLRATALTLLGSDPPRSTLAILMRYACSNSFYKDPQRANEQLRWLAMRHIQYNARPEHVTTFGHCIVAAMESAVGEDEWTPAMAEAWRLLWLEQSTIMIETMVEAKQVERALSPQRASRSSLVSSRVPMTCCVFDVQVRSV